MDQKLKYQKKVLEFNDLLRKQIKSKIILESLTIKKINIYLN